MNTLLDPIWPWSHLWDVLQRVPPSIRLVALAAAAAALALPALALARAGRRTVYVVASFLAAALLLVARHAWPAVGPSSFWPTLGGLLAGAALLVGPPAMAGVSVGTYFGGQGVSRRRLAVIVSLRLLAFALALTAIARPALAWIDRDQARGQVLIFLDRSRSMTVQDATGKASRWEAVRRAVAASEPAVDRLRDELGVDVRLFSFADDLAPWNPDQPGEADGKRTDFSQALRGGLDRRDPRLALRAGVLISDGADNGAAAALGDASRFRGLGASLHTFVCGNPAAALKQNDVAVTSITTSPRPFVPLKGKMTVKVSIDAHGFENSKAAVRLLLELPDEAGKLTEREVVRRNVSLPLTVGNEVTLTADAPATPGEYKVKVLVEGEPDDFPLNNVIETFVTVSKEGIAVLLIDRVRDGREPQAIINALAEDPRVSIDRVWVSGSVARAKNALPLLEEKPFDVILLGDVTVEQMRALDPEFLPKLERQLARGAGLLVIGGFTNLGNGDWRGSALANILPVDLTAGGQLDGEVRITPTADGLRRVPYLFRLDDDPERTRAWGKVARLDGATRLTLAPPDRRGLDLVLATADDEAKTPLLVTRTYVAGKAGAGEKAVGSRIVVFGGDTTYRWVRPRTKAIHDRFWRQMVTWVARQEEAQGSVWVRPDVASRRLPVRSDLGFAVGIRGKGGGPDVRDGKFTAVVTAPDGTQTSVPLSRTASETRGVFQGTKAPGTYTVTVSGEGREPGTGLGGREGAAITGQASARVIVYDEDVEMTRPAADPEFMRKLATAGGGEALTVEQLPEFLHRLAEQPIDRGKRRMELRPDWRTAAPSGFLPAFFAAFVAVVGLEWALRRWWGLV